MGTITISKPRKTHPYQKSRKSTMKNLVAIALLCFIAFASREVTGLETCDYTCRSDRSCSVNYQKSDSSGSRSGTCNCNSSGNCAYSNCPRRNPNCCAFEVGKTRKTLGGNSGNSGFGNNNGGFGSGNNGGFGSNNGGFNSNQEEKCSYNCKCDGGCEVSYTGPKTGATKGSCFPRGFGSGNGFTGFGGGRCSGAPSRCQLCSNRCTQQGTAPTDIMD